MKWIETSASFILSILLILSELKSEQVCQDGSIRPPVDSRTKADVQRIRLCCRPPLPRTRPFVVRLQGSQPPLNRSPENRGHRQCFL